MKNKIQFPWFIPTNKVYNIGDLVFYHNVNIKNLAVIIDYFPSHPEFDEKPVYNIKMLFKKDIFPAYSHELKLLEEYKK